VYFSATAAVYGFAFSSPLPPANLMVNRLVDNRWDSIGGGSRRISRRSVASKENRAPIPYDDTHCTLRAAARLIPPLADLLIVDLHKPVHSRQFGFLTLKRLAVLAREHAKGYEVRKYKTKVDDLLALPLDHPPLVVTFNGGHTVAIETRTIVDSSELMTLPLTFSTLRRVSGLGPDNEIELEVVAARSIHSCGSSRAKRLPKGTSATSFTPPMRM